MRQFCQIKLANAQVKIQEPVTRDSEDLQHLSLESITKDQVHRQEAFIQITFFVFIQSIRVQI